MTKNTVTKEGIQDKIVARMFTVIPGTTITLCVLTLENGYTVTGESACADPANFDKEKGEAYAEEAAIDKVWPLEGYLLREKLHQSAKQSSVYERLVTERDELEEKIVKLDAFVKGEAFKKIIKDEAERARLVRQLDVMREYADILNVRIYSYSPANG